MDNHETDDYEKIENMLSAFESLGQDEQMFIQMAKEWRGEEPLSLAEAYKLSSALQMKQFADEMPGGFFIYRADGDEEILYANDAVRRIFNCRTMSEFREWTGNSFRGIVHPEDLDAVEQSIVDQIHSSRFDLDYVEYRIIRRGGEVRWVDDYGHFVDNGAGGIFYVFIGDATEKKNRLMEERAALRRENVRKEEKWKNQVEVYSRELETISREHTRRQEIIEGLSIDYASIFYIDMKEGQVRPYRLSEPFQSLFGEPGKTYQFAECFEPYIQVWVHPEDQRTVRRAVNPDGIRQLLSSRNTYRLHYRTLLGGREIYQQLYLVNVGKDAQVSQVVMGYRNEDNEIRYELEQKRLLEIALEQAKTANAARNAFLANMSHDLRTPMNAIVGFTKLAREHGNVPQKVMEYLDRIEESGKLLLSLLDDVLEITRIESDQVRVVEKETNLLSTVEHIYTMALPHAQLKGISLSCDVSGLRHREVYADSDKLTEVLAHLAINAVKYTQRGGSVSITATEKQRLSGDYATYQFVVKDTGIGISEAFLPHIFEPFEREKNTTQSGVQGTGLGLAITKNIVERLGGNIEVTSQTDRGSRFVVTLSFRVLHPQDFTDMRGGGVLKSLRAGRKILLVEDNDLNREIGVELLQCENFQVDTATDGSIAVEMIKNSQPGEYALILMDIQMPVMDGYQATQLVRGLSDPRLAEIPIIALSANAFDEDRRRALKNGMNGHLPKPVSMDRLMEILSGL